MDKVSVLIIDDNETDRYLLKRTLNKTGIISKIFEANDGTVALELIKNYECNRQDFPDDFPPLIFFLDINMPMMNGFDFLKEFEVIRENLALSHIIMMFSSSERSEDKEKALSYCFVKSFIRKGSVDAEELKSKITDMIATQ